MRLMTLAILFFLCLLSVAAAQTKSVAELANYRPDILKAANRLRTQADGAARFDFERAAL